MLLTRAQPAVIVPDVLVVGGDVAASVAYCRLLRGDGWRVRSAPSNASSLAPWQPRPQLILLCGWRAVDLFLEQAPSALGAPGTVVVAHCYADPQAVAEALDRGVDVFIPQPCSAPVFLRRLRAARRWTSLTPLEAR